MAMPAFVSSDFDGIKTNYGYEVFLLGALSILGGGMFEWIIWLANPLFFISIRMALKKNNKALAISRTAACWLSYLYSGKKFWLQKMEGLRK